ncbi:MAG: bifunctional oligoribonuclease/PAP phosphatase NrnA [Eubacteriales bacterium]|nr:bifunctional oligoribonuclease/PAP phosphatase NrnA [Eubacteriales bacterium]
MPNSLRDIADWIKSQDGFLLVAHASPDGDALGASLGLFGVLQAMGKRAQVVCADPVPNVYRFLPWTDTVALPSQADGTLSCRMTIDCGDLRRTGDAEAVFQNTGVSCNIDHHVTNAGFGKLNYVDPNAAATGEIIYALIKELGASLTPDIATCLFAAISTDTGNFSYSNTTPNTFRTAAALMEVGLDVSQINRKLYRMVPYGKTLLLGHAIQNMRLYENGSIGMTAVTMQDFAACGAVSEDMEGIIDSVRDVDTVEIAIAIRQVEDKRYKVSLRSKEYADVAKLANAFGGGGHERAAGCTLTGELAQVQETVLSAAKAAIKK